MKAFLLAAGKGTRLKPYTDEHPKCLIPIHGKPLLGIWIDLLARHGVTDVLINTHHHAEQVERYVERIQRRISIALHIVYEPELLGSAGTIWRNRDFATDQSDFVIAYADNLTNLDLSKMVDMHRQFRSMGHILTMGLINAPNPRACGIATVDDRNKIVKFIEKPERPESNLANAGIYISTNHLFEVMADDADAQPVPWDLGYHVLPLLAGRMLGFEIPPFYLKDIGTPEAYREALDQWPGQKGQKE